MTVELRLSELQRLNALDWQEDWSGTITVMEAIASEPGGHRFSLRHLDLEMYHRLGERGVFEGLRVELIDGEVIEMSPMGPDHSDAVTYLNLYLARLDLPGVLVRCQTPVSMLDNTEPQPDFTLAPMRARGGPRRLETEPLLLIEIADSTLERDLGKKAAAYAGAGVPEYWVVATKARETTVHREPVAGSYSSIKRIPWTSLLTSSAVPGLKVTLSEVLW